MAGYLTSILLKLQPLKIQRCNLFLWWYGTLKSVTNIHKGSFFLSFFMSKQIFYVSTFSIIGMGISNRYLFFQPLNFKLEFEFIFECAFSVGLNKNFQTLMTVKRNSKKSWPQFKASFPVRFSWRGLKYFSLKEIRLLFPPRNSL